MGDLAMKNRAVLIVRVQGNALDQDAGGTPGGGAEA
jgi:hypothetical protein